MLNLYYALPIASYKYKSTARLCVNPQRSPSQGSSRGRHMSEECTVSELSEYEVLVNSFPCSSFASSLRELLRCYRFCQVKKDKSGCV